MITYNHEEFIEKAVHSVLAQECEFDYEIIIGEDCSIDATPAKLMKLQAQYPHKIKLLLNPVNIGVVKNFVSVFTAAQGEYIALLEGDDYWISTTKLQTQVDFLDNHPACSVCFHPVQFYENDTQQFTKILAPKEVKQNYTYHELAPTSPIQLASVMIRHLALPPWFNQLTGNADYPLYMLGAKNGLFGYISEVMSVYRVHSGGVWSNPNQHYHYWQKRYTDLKLLQSKLGLDLAQIIDNQLAHTHAKIVQTSLEKNDLSLAKHHFKKLLRCHFHATNQHFKLLYFLRLYMPLIYTFLQWLKNFKAT